MNYNNTTSHPSNPAIQLQPAVQSYQLQFSPLLSTQQEHTPSTDPLLQQQPYQMQVSPSMLSTQNSNIRLLPIHLFNSR